jgi:hypothetical protein
MWGYGVDLTGSDHDSVAGNETSDSTKLEFLEQLSNFQLLNNDSVQGI